MRKEKKEKRNNSSHLSLIKNHCIAGAWNFQ
jgi:hypothetical protein